MAREIAAGTGTCAACGRQMVLLDRDLTTFRGQDRPLCPLCAGDLAMWFAGLADIVERRALA